jgi:hypothetical protein
VRVSLRAYERAKSLAEARQLPIARVIEQAIEEAQRRAFFDRLRESMARSRHDPEVWAAYQAENRELEGTLADGLDPDEEWEWLAEAVRDGSLEFAEPPGEE